MLRNAALVVLALAGLIDEVANALGQG